MHERTSVHAPHFVSGDKLAAPIKLVPLTLTAFGQGLQRDTFNSQ